MRKIVASLFLLLALVCGPSFANFAIFQVNGSGVAASFSVFPIGAGGAVTGFDLQLDGTKFSRNDTVGAYVKTGVAAWQQVVTNNSMPAGDNGVDSGSAIGAYEIKAAPTNTSHVYMALNGYVFTSTNKGGNWTRSNFNSGSQDTSATGNNYSGPNMAVDPANENIVFYGTPNHLYTTANGFSTSITEDAAGVPAPTSAVAGSGVMVAFDPSSTVTSFVTQGIYACSNGHGVYHTTNAGGSWTLTTGSPTSCTTIAVDTAGVVWLIDNADGGGSGAVRKFSAGAWSSVLIAAGNDLHSLAIDPVAPSHVYVGTWSNGQLYVTTNGGTTFFGPTARTKAIATDIPWLVQASQDGNFTTEGMAFDPNGSNSLFNANGIGTFTATQIAPFTVTFTNGSAVISGANSFAAGQPVTLATTSALPTNFNNSATYFVISTGLSGSQFELSTTLGGSAVTAGSAGSGTQTAVPGTVYASNSAGIENLVVNQVIGTSPGKPAFAQWDRGGMVITPGTYPSAYGGVTCSNGLPSGWSIDVDPTGALAAALITPVFPINCGTSSSTPIPATAWSVFASQTPVTTNTNSGGCMAVSTTTHFLWLPTDDGATANGPWTTTNGGSTWVARTVGNGVPASGPTGWSANYYNPQFPCAADKVTADKYYLYNTNVPGTFVSTDGGATWAKASATNLQGGFFGRLQLKAVPGQANNLFFSGGRQAPSHPAAGQHLYQTIDGGVTWNAIANVTETFCVGFGKAAAGQTYPTVYYVGWTSGVYGVWKSIDNFASAPVKVGDGLPAGNLKPLDNCDGDMGVIGSLYMTTLGAGAFWGQNL